MPGRPNNVSSQNVGANPCGRPVGQVQDLPLPRVIEKIPNNTRSAWKWERGLIVLLLLPSLLLAGCGADTPEPGPQLSPLATPRGGAGGPALPTNAALSPLETPSPALPSGEHPGVQLVLLHTNDNWGETEPCG